MNSPASLCLSPAHKRKPSPSSSLQASKSKKLDLDDEMLLAASIASIEVKKENIDPDEQEALENIELLSLLDTSLKQEKHEVLVNSTTTAAAANLHIDDFQSQVKVESNDMERSSTTAIEESKTLDDEDLNSQLANQASSNKFLFYWFDLFEDQFNSHGTVYMFGKMPVKKKRDETVATAAPAPAATDASTPADDIVSFKFISIALM